MIEVIRVLRYTFDTREGYDAHRHNWKSELSVPGTGMKMHTLSVTTAEHPADNVIREWTADAEEYPTTTFPTTSHRDMTVIHTASCRKGPRHVGLCE